MNATVPLSALRPVWWGLPLFPGLAGLLPGFAPAFTGMWFFNAFYSQPVIQLAAAAGLFEWKGMQEGLFPLFPLANGLALGLLLELAMRAVGRRGGVWRLIRRRTARGVAIAAAAIVVGALGWRFSQWIDWPPRPTTERSFYELRQHAAQIRELRVYPMPSGLLDHLYAARFRISPEYRSELFVALQLREVPKTSIDDAFWSEPGAWWWDPPREGRFYASDGFSLTDRGRDGDHYLFMLVPGDDDAIWAWHRSNF